jgi:hypothetical protein
MRLDLMVVVRRNSRAIDSTVFRYPKASCDVADDARQPETAA